MCCLASGSTDSPSQAWSPVPPRCFWSTGARELDGAARLQRQKQKPPALIRRLSRQRLSRRASQGKGSQEMPNRSRQRFDFFFFLAAFLTVFLADFFAEDFFEAFL